MSDRDREFLKKLADLMEEYGARFMYTTSEDGIHISRDGEDIFIGFLGGDYGIRDLRKHSA